LAALPELAAAVPAAHGGLGIPQTILLVAAIAVWVLSSSPLRKVIASAGPACIPLPGADDP